jgi:hypothetical protein
MVETWRDSWFAEEGTRVLYVLPRGWTDATLPITLTPAPQALARVMVGRAEVITPETAGRLREQLLGADRGDSASREQAIAEFKKLGRFADPALFLATRGLDPRVNQLGWKLIHPTEVSTGVVPTGFLSTRNQ